MVEHADWESLELCLLNFLEKCEIDSEEITYPVVNLFNCTEMALSVILAMANLLTMIDNLSFVTLGNVFARFIATGGKNYLRLRVGRLVLWI